MCAPRVASWCPNGFLFFCQDRALTAGLTSASSESAWRKGGGGLPTVPPSYPFFAQPRPLLTGPPDGRDPATTTNLIECDSLCKISNESATQARVAQRSFWPCQNGVHLKGSALLLKTGSYDHELKELQFPSLSQLTQESLVDVRGVDHRQLLQAFDRHNSQQTSAS